MKEELFIKLPLVRSGKELQILQSKYQKYDPYYIASWCIPERKEKFERLWRKYYAHADSHFLQEVKINFHQRTWEMYMGNVLTQNSLHIKAWQDYGPDFVIDEIGYIECIAPTKGEIGKPDSVPEMFVAENLQEMRVFDIPSDKIILRITWAIKDKALVQYGKWKNKKWFNSQEPFIIAINIWDLWYPDDKDMPYVLKALFGFQHMQIGRYTSKITYSHRVSIEKSNLKWTVVPVTYFASPEFSFISGILFSDRTVLNHPNDIGSDCMFVNNPFATYPVKDEFSKLFKSWKAELQGDMITLSRLYK